MVEDFQNTNTTKLASLPLASNSRKTLGVKESGPPIPTLRGFLNFAWFSFYESYNIKIMTQKVVKSIFSNIPVNCWIDHKNTLPKT